MQLIAAITGDLRRIMAREVLVLKSGIKTGVSDASDRLKDLLRAQVREAGLSTPVEKAWQTKVYPKGDSMSASGWVYSKATRIHAAFDVGGTITPSTGQWLVIPMPAARRLKLDQSLRRSKGSRPRHWSDVDAAVRRFGALRRVDLPGGRVLLVADNVTASGARRKVRQGKNGAVQGIGGVSMPLFLLVKRVRLGKRLDIAAASSSVERDFLGLVMRGIERAERSIPDREG